MKAGFYPKDNKRFVGVTSVIEGTLGISDELIDWASKQALLAVQREQKKQQRIFTQKEVLELGLKARREILKKSQILGTEIHQAIQSHNNGYSYELEEEHKPTFVAYSNWREHQDLRPIIEEQKLYHPAYMYAGRIDFYGLLNGKNVLIDYKTSNQVYLDKYGLQLTAYREMLKLLGHEVEAMYVLHVKPIKRGGQEPVAQLIEVTTDFSVFEALLKVFWYRVAYNDVEWYPRTDEAAAEDQIKKELTESVNSMFESVQATIPQGHQLRSEDIVPSIEKAGNLMFEGPLREHWNLGETPTRELIGPVSLSEPGFVTIHNKKLPETRVDETSLPQTEIQEGILSEGVVVRFPSGSMPQILPEPFELPSETSILAPPELELDSSQDIRPARRQRNAELRA